MDKKKQKRKRPVPIHLKIATNPGQCSEPKPLKKKKVYTGPGPTLDAGELLRRIRVCLCTLHGESSQWPISGMFCNVSCQSMDIHQH